VFVELRNIHTHNRGFVSRLFLNRTQSVKHHDFVFKLEELYHVNFDEALSNNCIQVALKLDTAVSEKFHLKRKRYKQWSKAFPELSLVG
jgi:hypothetical protein